MASSNLPPSSATSPSPPLAAPAAGPLSERARKLINTTLGGRYKVLSLLGQGAMGEVFLVEHVAIRRRMALKLLSDEMSKKPEAVTRFEREALAAAQIDHPNVVAATDSGRTEEGALFVVFEYVDGQSLHDRTGKGPLAPPLALHITRQLASALARAHGLGIIHRDLKPQNIMLVERDGDPAVVKVLDFGLAKLSAALLSEGSGGTNKSEVLTRHGAIFGTPAYMAPEQAAGAEVDARTDLYAVGILLYELLAGALPFDGDAPTLLRHHLTSPVPAFKSRVPGVQIPPALESMVRKLLEKRPEDRFESAKLLLGAIDTLVKEERLQFEPNASPRSAAPASENETVVAPRDLPAQLYAQLPKEEQTESLALVLKNLQDGSGIEKGRSQDPSLTGLAAQFGAQDSAGPKAAAVSPLLTTAVETPEGPPKLKAPSLLDIDAQQPEAAATPVLMPAPAATLTERARNAIGEAAASLREGGSSAAKGVPSRFKALCSKAAERYAKLIDSVRARLPEKHRAISQRTLSLGVGAVLALPLLILIVIAASSDSDSSSSRSAMPGYASDREMEKAVRGDVREVEKLASKYPSDSRVMRMLARAQFARKDYVSAMRTLTALARLDQSMASDDDMIQIAAAAVLLPELSDSAISLLESQLGDKGVSLLSDLAERTTTEPAKSKLSASLQRATTRALASEATLVLLDLRAAPRCEDKRALLRRASQQGDARTLSYLQGLQQMTTGCGPTGQTDCWSCLHKSTVLKATIDALSKRLGG